MDKLPVQLIISRCLFTLEAPSRALLRLQSVLFLRPTNHLGGSCQHHYQCLDRQPNPIPSGAARCIDAKMATSISVALRLHCLLGWKGLSATSKGYVGCFASTKVLLTAIGFLIYHHNISLAFRRIEIRSQLWVTESQSIPGGRCVP